MKWYRVTLDRNAGLWIVKECPRNHPNAMDLESAARLAAKRNNSTRI